MKPFSVVSTFVVASLLAACSGSDPRLARHEGTTLSMTFAADGAETSRVPGTGVVELSALDGARRQLTYPAGNCSFTAVERDDGQLETFALEDQRACRLDLLLGTDAVPTGTEVELTQGNMSFYEEGDGDPVLLLSGNLRADGAVVGAWTWQLTAPHDE